MYVNTLGATSGCVKQSQRDEAKRMCACLSRDNAVISGFGASWESDAYVTSIDLSTSQPSSPEQCVVSIPMPADFDPKDPCPFVARPVCKPGLARPDQGGGSSTTPTSEPEEYEDSIVSSAMMKQQIMVFGILGLVLAGGSYMIYRVVKKG